MANKKMTKDELNEILVDLNIKAENLARISTELSKRIADLKDELHGSDGPITLSGENPPPPPPPPPR